jgi:hypothetical protein
MLILVFCLKAVNLPSFTVSIFFPVISKDSLKAFRNGFAPFRFLTLFRRRGKRKAAVAVAHTILIIVYHVLKHKVPYYELGPDYFDKLNVTYVKHQFVKRLERLGYKANLEPVPAVA